MADTTTEISTNECETHLSEKRVLELDILRQKVVGIQIKFDKAVEHLHSRLNDEASLLCGELERFERAADYTFADNRDFLLFQAKLRALEHARTDANELIEFIKKTLNDAYFSLFLHSTLDQLETRVLMATNEIFKLLRSKLDERKIHHIKNFCHIQSEFISAFSPLELADFFVWPYRHADQPPAANPRIYQNQFDKLRDMANDPICTWAQFESTQDRLKRERDSHIHDIYIEDMNWI